MEKENLETGENQKAGWVKIHRTLLDKFYFSKPHFLQLWIFLLLEANHKKKEIVFNGGKRILLPGELITGRRKMAIVIGCSETYVERMLLVLQKEQQVIQQKSSTNRLISIVNWSKYQEECQPNIKKSATKVTTKCQPSDTNKKKVLLNNNTLIVHPLAIAFSLNSKLSKFEQPLTDLEAEKIEACFPPTIIKQVVESMINKKDLLKKYSSAYLTLLNWCKGQIEFNNQRAVKSNGRSPDVNITGMTAN